MKNKRLFAFAAALVYMAAMLSGCGSAAENDSLTNNVEIRDNGGNSTGAALEPSENYNNQTIMISDDNSYAADEEEGAAVIQETDTTYAVPEYNYNTEEYAHIIENGFKLVKDNPLSTFSADVDTASYTNIRRMINDSQYVPADAVRIEEIMNYFDYDYPEAREGEPFSVTTELSYCPWDRDNQLLLVGISAKEDRAAEDVPMNLVFLIDVSGSMEAPDKLPLVQQAFSMLTDQLNDYDRISIVTYAGSDEVVLRGESGENKRVIRNAVNDLTAGGSTAGAAGIKTAYEIASEYYIEGGNNRVILATDGDLNVGASSVEELTALIEEKRDSGIYLSVLGFGSDNYKDNRLEAIADNGNGNYSYIDSVTEAKKVLIDEMNSTLVTVAEDVKFQVEFNPENVAGYRLIGYENRALADRDFNDDTKDAGEVGSGSTVTVLYEIIPAGGKNDYVPDLKYGDKPEQTVSEEVKEGEFSNELLTVNIRCKEPHASESRLWSYPVMRTQYTDRLPKNLNFAAACAEFGMLLRGSSTVTNYNLSWNMLDELLSNYDYSADEYKLEFEYLVRAASSYMN